jgi:asparagine synthase (glutamine-hydrolysing)
MCGIAGIVHRDGAAIEVADLERMLDRMAHRGPDDAGTYVAPGVGLGHRRLSIIDVSTAGHQPMPSPDRQCWITYNGEIYNYREVRRSLEQAGRQFRSDSDTEVLLHAYEEWGQDCLKELNGMFAFAIWDARRDLLFCARDRIGIKPFYYLDDGRRFAFASEIKALLALPGVSAEPDPICILDYLSFSYVRGSRTLFRGIEKLLPGEMLTVGRNGLQRSVYWDVEYEETDRRSEDEIVEELAWTIDDAVRIQLRADVPVGTHLSGGLDSSLVTGLARKHHPGRLLSFNGRFAEGEAYDESAYARTMAEAADTELVDVLVTREDLYDRLAHLTWHMDEPTAGPGLIPQFSVCREARKHVTVALGGQGGDEIFVGYPRYRSDLLRHQAVSLLRGRRPAPGFPALGALTGLLRESGPRAAASLFLRRLEPVPAPATMARFLQTTAATWNLALTPAELREVTDAEHERRIPAARSPLGRLLHYDLKNYLPALLHVEDRTSMAVSLESRVPLLDHRIVEIMARVPAAMKFPGFRQKHLLRRVASPVVPASIVGRHDKMGFPTPLSIWLQEGTGDPRLDEAVSGATLRRAGILRGAPRPGTPGESWALLSLEMWMRTFVERSAAATSDPAPRATPTGGDGSRSVKPPSAAA